MINQFRVIDTVRQHWAARANFPERTDHLLILLDEGKAPMRQMPRYLLDGDQGEVEKFSAGQLNGKSVEIEVREMSGKGNPQIRGKVVGVVNGAK